jgi:hypothetical protein
MNLVRMFQPKNQEFSECLCTVFVISTSSLPYEMCLCVIVFSFIFSAIMFLLLFGRSVFTRTYFIHMSYVV